MYFVDSSGHTFFQQSFDYRPVGYEYYKNKYIFWIDNKDHSYCSVNNYYIRPIYILTDRQVSALEIRAGSAMFALFTDLSDIPSEDFHACACKALSYASLTFVNCSLSFTSLFSFLTVTALLSNILDKIIIPT